MKIIVKIKLHPTKEQEKLIRQTMREYIRTVNALVSYWVEVDAYLKLTTKNILVNLPSTLKNQCIRDALSLYSKFRKTGIIPVLKKPYALWNNQRYRVTESSVFAPFNVDGICQKVAIAG